MRVLYVESRFRGRRPFAVLREADTAVIRPLDVVGAPEASWVGAGDRLQLHWAATALAERQDAEDGLLLLSVGIASLGICVDEQAPSREGGESEAAGEGGYS